MKKIKVGILGATGMVGQRFIDLLADHPWFEISELAASERSAGKTYSEAVKGRWKVSGDVPEIVQDIKVKECTTDLDCKLVFSAMDAEIAGPLEEEYAKAGYVVASNAKNHRMLDDVPLLMPEINGDHLEAVERQKQRLGGEGFIVTNPNCTLMGMTMTLKPLMDSFGVKDVILTSLQALSGAGYPGVPSMDVIDNLVPYIGGEEPKVESEPLKILGGINSNGFENAPINISASCTRVPVRDGHTLSINVKLDNKPSIEDFSKCMADFNPLKGLGLPSAPNPPIIIRTEDDRPQPGPDRMAGNGMAVSVGRIRDCNIFDYKYITVAHNTIRGAAGASILNAELMKSKGLI